jgi:hypothetical protein
MIVDWTAEQIVVAIRDDIDAYEKLKTRLSSASGEEARRIELQKLDKVTQIRELQKELLNKEGGAELWKEFIPWEKSLS